MELRLSEPALSAGLERGWKRENHTLAVTKKRAELSLAAEVAAFPEVQVAPEDSHSAHIHRHCDEGALCDLDHTYIHYTGTRVFFGSKSAKNITCQESTYAKHTTIL